MLIAAFTMRLVKHMRRNQHNMSLERVTPRRYKVFTGHFPQPFAEVHFGQIDYSDRGGDSNAKRTVIAIIPEHSLKTESVYDIPASSENISLVADMLWKWSMTYRNSPGHLSKSGTRGNSVVRDARLVKLREKLREADALLNEFIGSY